MRNIQRYTRIIQQLSLQQVGVITVTAWRLTLLTIILRVKSFDWCWQKMAVAKRAAESLPNNTQSDALVVVAEQLHEIVRLASRLLPFSCECLPRSIVLRDMLQRKGIDAIIQLGVNKSSVTMQSHAWVEVAGQAIGEKTDLMQSFKVIQTTLDLTDSQDVS